MGQKEVVEQNRRGKKYGTNAHELEIDTQRLQSLACEAAAACVNYCCKMKNKMQMAKSKT
jgi:hypothetical protein